jgi:hypothetical protein
MHSLFRHTPVDSPILIILTIVFFITSSIVTFDVRLIQAKRRGDLPPDEPMLPKWVTLIYWPHWGLHVAFVILNWKYAVFLFIIRFNAYALKSFSLGIVTKG